MGNDGNEYKIITQVFLYKFLNDKFAHEVKKISPKLASAEKWDSVYLNMTENERLDMSSNESIALDSVISPIAPQSRDATRSPKISRAIIVVATISKLFKSEAFAAEALFSPSIRSIGAAMSSTTISTV